VRWLPVAPCSQSPGNGNDITTVYVGGTSATVLPGQTATEVVVQGPAGAGTPTVSVISTSFGNTTFCCYTYNARARPRRGAPGR
jgi:hypothetical protein